MDSHSSSGAPRAPKKNSTAKHLPSFLVSFLDPSSLYTIQTKMSPVAVGDSAGATGAAALLHSLYAAPDAKSCEVAAQALTEYVSSSGIRVLHSDNILDDLVRASKSKSGYEREGSMVGMDHLFRTLGREGGYDPYFIPLLSPILERFQETGQGAVVKDAAEKAAKQLVRLAPPEASPKTLDALFAIVEGGAKWKTKVGALDLIGGFATRAKEQVAERLGEIIPKLSEAMQDTKPEVRYIPHLFNPGMPRHFLLIHP